jgi:glycosyltransferase involved in cell wall biosynthesis
MTVKGFPLNGETNLATDENQNLLSELSFLAEFHRMNGRALRVLHIGNIANNAYNNACIQRQYGIEADVLCYNYYHIMGCPEWEDSDVRERSSAAAGLDHFKPDWWATNLRGWSRPRWFVQGPSALCIDYLRAKNAGWKVAAALKWLQLEFAAWDHAQSAQPDAKGPNNLPRRLRFHGWVNSSAKGEGGGILSLYKFWVGTSVANGVLGPRPSERIGKTAALFNGISAAIWRAIRRVRKPGLRNDEEHVTRVRQEVEESRGKKRVTFRGLSDLLFKPIRVVLRRLLVMKAPISNSGLIAASMLSEADRLKEIERLTNAIREDPVELDGQSLSYREEYITNHPRPFEVILPHYDIIQGYAIDGLIPLINGVKNFTSYEHGTLREIPFEKNLTGLICRFAFQLSPQVFVTNSDVLPSVERLGLRKDSVTYLPHAFDDAKLLRFRAGHPELAPPASGPVLFFSPTRQHWKSGNSSWQKGNDVFIRAAAQIVSRHDFKVVLVEWGQEVADSRTLIDELGLSSKVDWVPPMSKTDLWKYYCSCHAVVDQFVVPALGGVGFESMVLGRRLITAIDREQTALFFGKAPPCLNAISVEECATRMLEVIEDPLDTRGCGEAARRWMAEYHSAERIVALQSKAYNTLLSGQWDSSVDARNVRS